ncbi:hypothetical protein BT96DRAFT_1003570 [Gymnopus androsaceus JB14]|uniref:F-box domain-containing protein n=1 Tax=Gymnopus androsaceus JB14 TaxID=1447944 RepID=A0A6A4GUS2_9AGAR|nr:hypothetical protein BT96DRAFT_1003570 [Gymnopus androsaceus JB14]
MSESILPEEILHSVVESLAYNPEFVERKSPPFSLEKRDQRAFSFLSLATNFDEFPCPFSSHILEVDGAEHLKMFQDQCISNTSFAASIRSLSVSLPGQNTFQITSMMKPLLCYLKDLSQLDARFRIDIPLLAELNRHSVKTVVVTSLAKLPKTLGSPDLEKIILCGR